MNALDRKVAAIIAAHLHQQDPRFVWEARPADPPARPADDEKQDA